MCIRHRPSQPLVAVAAHVLTDPWRVPRCALCREKGSEEHDSWTFLWLMSVPHTCCHVSYRPLVLDLTMCTWAMIGCRLCRHSKKRGSPQEQIYPWVSHSRAQTPKISGVDLRGAQPLPAPSRANWWIFGGQEILPIEVVVKFRQLCYSQVQQYRKKSLRPNQDLADEPWPKPPKHGLTSLTTWGFWIFSLGYLRIFCCVKSMLFFSKEYVLLIAASDLICFLEE